MSGLPPGLPGGGITGVLPAFGVGARISGSTPGGGQSTPSDLASLSLSDSAACPVVVPGSLPGKPLPDGSPGPSLYCAVIVKQVDAQTRAKTAINELLRL